MKSNIPPFERSVGSMTFGLVGLLLLLMVTNQAHALDLPVIIGELVPPDPETYEDWGDWNYCFGDVNLDGKDDLFIVEGFEAQGAGTYVRLHFGGERINSEPDLLLGGGPDYMNRHFDFGEPGCFGRITPARNRIFTLLGQHDNGPSEYINREVFVYNFSEDLDSIPEDIWRWYGGNGPKFAGRINDHQPTDLNGDGIDDMLYSVYEFGEWSELRINFGGEDFDSIPDWRYTLPYGNYPIYSTGRDINGDGCDDVFLKITNPAGGPRYFFIFLGGSPMDTIPIFRFERYDFEGPFGNLNFNGGFNLLPDINGDGYDEWGLYWSDLVGFSFEDGFYIFFGSDSLDLEPDMNLEGCRGMQSNVGYIEGGDFNNDGVGDVVTGLSIFPSGLSEIMIHFGRYPIPHRPPMNETADIYIDTGRDYDGRYRRLSDLGAIGDYNGDGADDFVVHGSFEEDHSKVLVVFAGNTEWRHWGDVKDPRPLQPVEIEVKCYPNPFNSSVTIYYSTGKNAYPPRLAVYDLSGRLVKELLSGEGTRQHPVESGRMPDLRAGGGGKSVGYGDPTVEVAVWDATDFPAGIYFVRLESGREVVSKKVVLMK